MWSIFFWLDFNHFFSDCNWHLLSIRYYNSVQEHFIAIVSVFSLPIKNMHTGKFNYLHFFYSTFPQFSKISFLHAIIDYEDKDHGQWHNVLLFPTSAIRYCVYDISLTVDQRLTSTRYYDIVSITFNYWQTGVGVNRIIVR